MSKDLGPPNKQPQHLIIASTVRPPLFTESHPGIPGSESNSGFDEERFREVGPRVLSAADGQVLGSVAFLLFVLRSASYRENQHWMLNAEWRDLHPNTGSGPRRAPEAPWGIFCHGAHTWNGLALWDCGGGTQPRMLEAGNFPVRPVSRDILEDLNSDRFDITLDAT
jgi:hypothetical protein